jgi:NAD(P)-dependent dehydrogenase (short-subunit alcohol dehydrogenase family)
MKDFSGKLAVITGGGSGMGRELVRQLAMAGCHVAACDLSLENLQETLKLTQAEAPAVRITTHLCDVSDEAAILAFRDEVIEQHQTKHINLLFNNAGISSGGSLFTDSRESWDHCFQVCWGGVYFGTRVFLPLLIAAEEAHIINTSSLNGFWASLGPDRPHTAYSTAKFAVKGFTEALITDLRCNAPHVKASVVMPGHIGTSIVENSLKHSLDEVDEDMAGLMQEASDMFRDSAPMSAADASAIILEGVKQERWRILVGEDAHAMDAAVRSDPEAAYEEKAFAEIVATVAGEALKRSTG